MPSKEVANSGGGLPPIQNTLVVASSVEGGGLTVYRAFDFLERSQWAQVFCREARH
jgi:hypothetical protein